MGRFVLKNVKNVKNVLVAGEIWKNGSFFLKKTCWIRAKTGPKCDRKMESNIKNVLVTGENRTKKNKKKVMISRAKTVLFFRV